MVKRRTYSGEYKQKVVEHMRNKGMSFRETARVYGIDHKMVMDWERIYLEEGPGGLYVERRGRHNGVRTGRPPAMPQEVEKDLISENQRLRAEVAYLKKLRALIQEQEQCEKKRGQSGN